MSLPRIFEIPLVTEMSGDGGQPLSGMGWLKAFARDMHTDHPALRHGRDDHLHEDGLIAP